MEETYKTLQKKAGEIITKLKKSGLSEKEVDIIYLSMKYDFITSYLEDNEFEEIIYEHLKNKLEVLSN